MFNSILKKDLEPQSQRKVPVVLLISGLIVFCVMGAMAWILYKERMLNFDPAFFSFLMLQEEWFSPVLGRYGTVLSQILPFSLMKAGADLETILRFYSLSFVLLYIIYLLFIGLLFKDKKGIIAICIALTLTFRETFYYSTAELYQAIGLSVLLWSMFSHSLNQVGKKRTLGLILCAMMVVGISFFHQLALFTVFFVLSITYLERRQWKDYYALILLGWALLWFIFRIKFLTVSEYEQENLLTAEKVLEGLSNFGSLHSRIYFSAFFENHLIIPSAVCVLGLAYLLIKRRWLISAYIGLFTVGYWVVIMIGKSGPDSPIMLQNYYTVFGLFAGVLLALALEKRSILVKAGVILILGMFSLKNIYQSRYDYQLRTEYLSHIAEYGQQFPERKYVMHASHLPWSFVWINWALPFETLLNSEIDSELESVTFFSTFELDTLDSYDIDRPESFLGPAFEPHWFSAPSLNTAYFSVPNGPYRLLNTAPTEDLLLDSLIFLPELQIIPFNEAINKSGGWTSLKIKLSNNTETLLHSIYKDGEGLYLYHRITNADGETWKTEKRRLMFDLAPGKHYTEILAYDHPRESNCKMEFGFFLAADSSFIPKAQIQLNIN